MIRYKMLYLLIVFMFSFSSHGFCDSNASGIVGDLVGLKVDAGYMREFTSNNKEDMYYNIEYKGKPFYSKGLPLYLDDINKPPSQPDPKNIEGDTNSYVIKLSRGAANLSGGLFDLIGTQNLPLPQPFSQLRGSAQLSGTLDWKNINVSAGLETPPFHPVSF